MSENSENVAWAWGFLCGILLGVVAVFLVGAAVLS